MKNSRRHTAGVSDVPRAPLPHRFHDWPELPALAGEDIFRSRWVHRGSDHTSLSRTLRKGRSRSSRVSRKPAPKGCFSNSDFSKRKLERAKGFEPSTPTLARSCSTPELHPRPWDCRLLVTGDRQTYAKCGPRMQQLANGYRNQRKARYSHNLPKSAPNGG
jgi:hypothetical protein